MRKYISAEVEFLFGLISILLVSFLIPLGVSVSASSSGKSSAWPFMGYLYLPIGILIVLHALGDTLDKKEKDSVLSSMGPLGRVCANKKKEPEKETE